MHNFTESYCESDFKIILNERDWKKTEWNNNFKKDENVGEVKESRIYIDSSKLIL